MHSLKSIKGARENRKQGLYFKILPGERSVRQALARFGKTFQGCRID